MFTISDVLDIAVQIEENGESFYRSAAEHMVGSTLRETLLWLAEAELRHKEVFFGLKQGLVQGNPDAMEERIESALLKEAVDRHALSLEEVDFETIPDANTLIDIAIGFEEDSISFYEILTSFMDDVETIDTVRRITNEELIHIETLLDRRGMAELNGIPQS